MSYLYKCLFIWRFNLHFLHFARLYGDKIRCAVSNFDTIFLGLCRLVLTIKYIEKTPVGDLFCDVECYILGICLCWRSYSVLFEVVFYELLHILFFYLYLLQLFFKLPLGFIGLLLDRIYSCA